MAQTGAQTGAREYLRFQKNPIPSQKDQTMTALQKLSLQITWELQR